jgi:hypothetical protein
MFGLLMSMLAYLLSLSGSPAAIEGSIPLKETTRSEHSGWSAQDQRFRHRVPKAENVSPSTCFRTAWQS